MSKLEIKEKVLNIIGRMNFSESVEENRTCPECKKSGRKGTITRRITKERQQNIRGKWFVEICDNADCDYWNAGFA